MITAGYWFSLLGGALQLQAALAQQTCNGYADYCSKQYDQLVMMGAHNSYAVSRDMTNLAANQAFNVTTQLRNGIRLLQGQGHEQRDQINLCHTSCGLLNGGTLKDYLADVKAWMDENPNEVVTALWVNYDNLDVSTWAEAYQDAGLDEYAYTPSDYPIAYGSWPTLQELIDDGKRLVSFIDNGADYSQCPYLLDEFSHIWETPFDSTDPDFPCTVDRPKNEPDNKMYLINHFLAKNISIGTTPDVSQLNTTNSQDSIMSNVDSCQSTHSQSPSFILFDYYAQPSGDVFEAEAQLNGVTYQERPIGNSSLTNGGADESGDGGNGNTAVDSSDLSSAVVSASLSSAWMLIGLIVAVRVY